LDTPSYGNPLLSLLLFICVLHQLCDSYESGRMRTEAIRAIS